MVREGLRRQIPTPDPAVGAPAAARSERVCFRHSTRPARRRCYRCQRWLCPRCQERRAHHIFCGGQCYWAWTVETQVRRLNAWVRRRAVPIGLFALLTAVLTGGGLAFLLSYSRSEGTLQPSPAVPRSTSTRPPETPIPWTSELIRILRPAFGARLSAPQVTVEGQGPPRQSLTLWVNGEVAATTVSGEDGTFVFPDVLLEADDNLLQVQGRGPNGAEVFSPAIVVYQVADRTASGLRYVQRAPDNLLRGNPNRPEVALTLDGSFSDQDVDALIRQVEALQLPVTVFLTGEFIDRYPEATRRLAASPWVEVGNHTLNHRHWTAYQQTRQQSTLPDVTPQALQFELAETARRFRTVTGRAMAPLWRAPYGEHNAELRQWAAGLGYTHVGWTVESGWTLDTMDWIDDPAHPMYRPGPAIVRDILALAERPPHGINGGIVLMHLGSRRPAGDRMVDVLPELVQGLRQRGYTLVHVSTLLRRLRHPRTKSPVIGGGKVAPLGLQGQGSEEGIHRPRTP
ncbi:MAG: polysaccharide deacetylase family protein [Acidobacteria bacterium]|nr:polysaccharide deacetylase family protein [Acidobacteriota bacterium]MDW7983838.1 polysaccharide deacetylase family protein [Acidobacteriota bacterium]